MCGIAGALVFNKSDYLVETAYLNKMRDTMIHRGPDGGDTWVSKDKKIGLAHRRLSIIDLSVSATQPMSNEDNTIFITFNGEIYNHAEIRSELKKTHKHKWKTDHSDTEVIIHAFEQWGIKCIDKFRGMFAFAIWDSRKEELWLVRDRMGIKPLYYSVHDGRIVFASEIKALLEDPEQQRIVDERALYDYLSFLVAPAPNTLFEGIKKLPCATYIKVNKNGEFSQIKYWDMLDKKRNLKSWSHEKIATEILKELKASVKLRKESDVPVGVFLSGGIDSSTNAALFSEDAKLPVNTFTIGYKGNLKSYRNENQYARSMADTIKANYFERLLDIDDIISFLPEMIRLQDEPLADPVSVSQYYVSKLAREHGIIVCQIGEGADELFNGYRDWNDKRKIEQLGKIPCPKRLKKLSVKILSRLGRDENINFEKLRRSANGQPTFWGSNDIFTEKNKKDILSNTMNNKFKDYTTWESIKQIYAEFNKRAKEKSALNWMTYMDLTIRVPDLLLTKVDKMGMGASLEARVPFLDYKLVELALNIPQSVKIQGDSHKYILKKAVRGLIPDEIIDRKKVGFGLPIDDWYSGKLGKVIKKEIRDFVSKTDYFNKKGIEKLMKEGNSLQIWCLFNLALWWKEYIGEK
jgi:asparagine synthase (glutamine-hydrolysing)